MSNPTPREKYTNPGCGDSFEGFVTRDNLTYPCGTCLGIGYMPFSEPPPIVTDESRGKAFPEQNLEAQAPSNSGVYGGSHVCHECGKPVINGMICDHKEPPKRKVKNMSKQFNNTPGNWSVLADPEAIPLATFQYEESATAWRDKMCRTGIVIAASPLAASAISEKEGDKEWPKKESTQTGNIPADLNEMRRRKARKSVK